MLPGKRTAEGAIYVLQGPPPAGTPLVGGIAVTTDGVIYASNASSLPGFPTNTVAPSISGTPVVGQTLTCTPGTWTGTPTPTVTRQWRANGVNIPGATGTTYVVELAYANQNIRCLETATNSVGTASAQSNSLTIAGAPVNTTAPIITGNAEVGSVLTTGNGTWVSTPTATYAYAWFSDGVVIPGQTANTYTTLAGDVGKTITSRVTATNPAGSVQVNSQNGILVTAIPGNPPVNTVAPVISGNATVGSVLTTTNGTWTGDAPITYTYTWRADNVSIPGATSQTYTTVTGDVGKSIVCRVTATNAAGTANATSNAIVVTAAVPTFTPASLFASGEQGIWLDPSDLTTMFQDRAGTIQVTADGQTVGKILDKSGRGNHATAPSDAARPLYKTSGGLHWIQFDGVDDALITASIDFSASNSTSVFHGDMKSGSAGPMFAIELSSNALSNKGCFYNKISDSTGDSAFQLALNGESTYNYSQFDPSLVGAKEVIASFFNFAGATVSDQLKFRKNGVAKTRSGGTTNAIGSRAVGAYPLNIGWRSGSYFNGNFYSIIVLGRTATTQEITDTETWVAAKTGVTLP